MGWSAVGRGAVAPARPGPGAGAAPRPGPEVGPGSGIGPGRGLGLGFRDGIEVRGPGLRTGRTGYGPDAPMRPDREPERSA